ncbi:MAG: hypothetical protein D3914_00715 [Candidatus Electrothrix sp. LOE2]|jgi:hypothetical protein|nr:hypothetical protein [Candidatus Electrothrix sp. LOE2]
MTEQPTKKQTPDARKPNDLTVILKGRVKSHKRIESDNGDFFATLLVIPAEDEFSHPKTFAVNASAPLGSKEQDVEVLVEARPNNRKKDGTYYHNVSLWRVEDDDRPF